MHRRRLRNELRAARVDKGLTQEQVAKAMEWSLSKMNRIEKAKTGISANDLNALLQLYGITEEEQTEELREMARQGRQAPWWRGYSDSAPASLLELIDYEWAASAISQFEPVLVPGVLQTEDYARAVLREFWGEGSEPERVPALVDLRTRRRDLLTSDGAPGFSFVLDQAVVRRLAAIPSIGSQQLAHLVEMAEELPNVTIQVVPFDAGLYPGIKGAFKVIEFEGEPDDSVAYLESLQGGVLVEEPLQADSYLQTFRRIKQAALDPSDSVDLLRKAAG